MSCLTTLFVATSMALGQTADSVDPNLKQLAPLVGSWNVTFDVPDIPFTEAKVTYKWVMEGKYLEARWSKPDGTYLGPELFVWDPIGKTIRMWGFDPESFYEATWSIEGRKFTGKYTGTRLKGEKTKDTIVLEFESDSSITAKATSDDPQKPGGSFSFTRVSQGE
jgi:hypothetical protein